jgi:hypothetical protein
MLLVEVKKKAAKAVKALLKKSSMSFITLT